MASPAHHFAESNLCIELADRAATQAVVSDVSRLRACGFGDVLDTAAMFIDVFDRRRIARAID